MCIVICIVSLKIKDIEPYNVHFNDENTVVSEFCVPSAHRQNIDCQVANQNHKRPQVHPLDVQGITELVTTWSLWQPQMTDNWQHDVTMATIDN